MAGRSEYRLMSNELDPKIDLDQSMVYQIRIKGHLSHRWTEWFGGLTITLEARGETLLTGPVADQAALYGLLKKVRDLGMPLLSVHQVEPGHADMPDVKPGPNHRDYPRHSKEEKNEYKYTDHRNER